MFRHTKPISEHIFGVRILGCRRSNIPLELGDLFAITIHVFSSRCAGVRLLLRLVGQDHREMGYYYCWMILRHNYRVECIHEEKVNSFLWLGCGYKIGWTRVARYKNC